MPHIDSSEDGQMTFSNPLGGLSDESDEEGTDEPGTPKVVMVGAPRKLADGNSDASADMLSDFQSFAEDQIDHTDLEEERERRHQEALIFMDANNVISPDSPFRQRWDLMQVPLLMYVAAAVPYRIGFSADTHPWEMFFCFDIFVDLFFILDIALSFRTAVWNKHGELDYLPSKISKAYIKSWFVIDILGCLPINYVVLIIDPNNDAESSAARGNKFFRILRLFKLLKLLRLARLKRIIARYEEEFYALASGFAIIKIVICIGVIGHWLACLWYGVGDVIDETAVSATGDRVLTWTETQFGEFVCDGGAQIVINANDTQDEDNRTVCINRTVCLPECASFRMRCAANGSCTATRAQNDDQGYIKYLTALYWAFMTMTTVGYGDLPAGTSYEKWVAVLGMLIGGFTFGLIVGALGEMARKANPGETFRTKKIGQISAYLARRGITPDLLRRIRLYFQNHYETSSVFADKEYADYFSRLPSDQRLQLAKEVGYLDSSHKPGILARIPSFSGLDTMSLGHVSRIVRRGESAWEMIVILDGIVNVSAAESDAEVREFLKQDDDQAREYGEQLKSGGFVDEHVALLPPHSSHTRTQTLFAQSDCSIALLSAEDVYMLRSERAEIDRHLRSFAAAAKRAETVKTIKRIFLTIDQDGSGDVDLEEFSGIMEMMGSDLPEEKIQQVFQAIDVDAGGTIDADEFAEWWLAQESADTSTGQDGQVVTNKDDFDIQTLKQDLIKLDRTTMAMQQQMNRIMQVIQEKL